MQQRRLRLGDILDDYCPRERRITNHAVVAMIDDEVKQTRCTTCDADHEYKQARVPAPRRKKDALLDSPDADHPMDDTPLMDGSPAEIVEAQPADEPQVQAAATEETEDGAGESRQDDDGPVHRRLIRATLPRPEGQNPERKEPDFTIRHGGRGGREFDGNRMGGGGQRHGRGRRAMRGGGGGQGQPGGQSRFGGPRHNGGGQGQRQNGNRPGSSGGGGQRGGGRPQGQRGPGRKRGR